MRELTFRGLLVLGVVGYAAASLWCAARMAGHGQ